MIASRTVPSSRRWGLAAVFAAAQTEFPFQYGNLVNPFSAESTPSRILTYQQASGWSLGDSFFFIDYIDDGLGDGFNDKDFYGKWYPTLGFGRMSGRTVGGGAPRGAPRDVALIGGINFGGDADFFKYLPGRPPVLCGARVLLSEHRLHRVHRRQHRPPPANNPMISGRTRRLPLRRAGTTGICHRVVVYPAMCRRPEFTGRRQPADGR